MTGASATPNDKPAEKGISFSKPEQIQSILAEVCRLKLQVLIKYSLSGKSIRGAMENVDVTDNSVRISGISPQGDLLLKGHQNVRVEFILLSTKLVFVGEIRARVPGKLLLGLPKKLVAIERRNNARFRVPADFAAFVEFPNADIDTSRFDAHMVPAFMRGTKATVPKLRIDDVSLGGFAAFTRFPAIAEALKPDSAGHVAFIHFPNSGPIVVPISIRWTKKTLSKVAPGQFEKLMALVSEQVKHIVSGKEIEAKETYFRLGLQFAEVSKEMDAALRVFIRLIQQAESV